MLDDHGLLGGVRRIAGTSAGAITAALLAAGGRVDGLKHAVLDTDFADFLDGRWGILGEARRLFSQFGLHQGNRFEEILARYLKEFCGHSNLTFGELRDLALKEPARYRQLFVVASNITYDRAEVLCAENHPDMPVATAIRTSMSIPIIFKPVKFAGSVYVDGGLSWNYPIDVFDHLNPHDAQPRGLNARVEDTLGFVLTDTQNEIIENGEWKTVAQETSTLTDYLKAIGEFMYETANHQHLHQGDVFRTVFIDDLGVKTTDFNVVDSVIKQLVESGKQATRDYLTYRRAVIRGERVARAVPHAFNEKAERRVEQPPAN